MTGNLLALELSPKMCAGVDERPLDVTACVRAVRRGDEKAARALMDRLYPLVLKLVRAYLPRRTSEQDLVQTVFLKVFANLKQYAGQAPIEHWVSRIAVNTCLNELKAEKIRPEWRWSDLSEEEQYVMESLAAVHEEHPEHSPEAASELVNRLMRSLSPPDRLIVKLLHLEETSVAEISRITGWNPAVIKVRAFRARKKLRKILNELERGNEKENE